TCGVGGGVGGRGERNPPRATQPIIWPILGMLESPFARAKECRERAAKIGQDRVAELGAERAGAHGVSEALSRGMRFCGRWNHDTSSPAACPSGAHRKRRFWWTRRSPLFSGA